MPRQKPVNQTPTRKSVRFSRSENKSHADNSTKRKRGATSEETSSEVRKFMRKSRDGREIDFHCWTCHKRGQDRICVACPRVFHNHCLKSSLQFSPEGACPECQLESVDGTKLSRSLTCRMLKKLLQFLLMKIFPSSSEVFEEGRIIRMKQRSTNVEKVTIKPEFIKWPQDEYKMCRPMDMEILIDNINADVGYTKTAEFFSDVKWIHHNCCKAYGNNAEITRAAIKLLKIIKEELLDIEACYECYDKKYNLEHQFDCDPFQLLCENPHILLWVKLKGYSYWPSKCLKVIDDVAHIRFFGSHEKASVKTNSCYLISKENPSGKKSERASYKSAVEEMYLYVRNYERKYGSNVYAKDKTVFCPKEKSKEKAKKKTRRKRKSQQDFHECASSSSHHTEPLEFENIVSVTDSSSQNQSMCETDEMTIIDIIDDSSPAIVIDSLQDESSPPTIMIESVDEACMCSTDDASQIRISSTGVADVNTFRSEENIRGTHSKEHAKNLISNYQSTSRNISAMMYNGEGFVLNNSNNSSVLCPNEYEASVERLLTRPDGVELVQVLPVSVSTSYPIVSNSSSLLPSFSRESNLPRCTPEFSYQVRMLETSNLNLGHEGEVTNGTQVVSHFPAAAQASTSFSGDRLRPEYGPSTSSPFFNQGRTLPGSDEGSDVVEFLFEAEKRHRDDSKISFDNFSNLASAVSNPEAKDAILKTGNYMKAFPKLFLSQCSGIANAPKCMILLGNAIATLSKELEDTVKKYDDLKKVEFFKKKLNNLNVPWNFATIILGLKKKICAEYIARLQEEKKKSDYFERRMNFYKIQANKRKKQLLRYQKDKKCYSNSTQTETLCADFISKEEFDLKVNALKLQCKNEKNEEVLKAKKNDWCIVCTKPANIHCCWNTNYCDSRCQKTHQPQHQSSCKRSPCSESSSYCSSSLVPAAAINITSMVQQVTHSVGVTYQSMAKSCTIEVPSSEAEEVSSPSSPVASPSEMNESS